MGKVLSVITTTYNAGSYLLKYFENILNLQDLEQFQFLLVMNEPNGKERQIASSYLHRHPELFTILEIDQKESIGASLNRGFIQINTPYCSFLDVDDIRVNDSFLRQIATLEKNADIDFTYGDYIIVPAQGEVQGKYISPMEFDRFEFTRGCYASPTQLFRTRLLGKIGLFDEQLRSGGDFDFQVRAALNCEFKKTPGLLGYYTKSGENASASSTILQPPDIMTVMSVAIVLVLLVSGLFYFRRMERTFADVV